MTKAFTDIDPASLDALIQRVSEAKEHELTLSAEDCQLLLDVLVTLATMQEQLASNDITIIKLRKLVGIVKSSETLSGALTGKPAKKKKKSKKPQTNKVKPVVKQHTLTDLSKGDDCPECQAGKLYKYDPATLLRITGQSPFVPEQHVMDRLRCNTCGAYFTAPLPKDVLDDGDVNQKYGYSARSLMAIAKYAMGSPFYRQGSLQDLLGVAISASTIFDQVEYLSNHIYPVFKQLIAEAADAEHYYLDDTTHRILNQTSIVKQQRNSDKTRVRTGVYTSGIIATTAQNKDIVLFETNIGHAGEFIDSILTHRAASSLEPLLMSDALSSNKPTVTQVQQSFCNSHGRRQFYDVISHFPDEVEEMLICYGKIWDYDDEVKSQNLAPDKRLSFHQQHSLPVMAHIKQWGHFLLDNETVEENSGLGKAINYFIKHYEELTCFCRVEGARLDNNKMEAQLKLVVRDRKNAMFHKTQAGASVGDVITSMIATAGLCGINVFDYFNVLQRKYKEVKAQPENYLPWNYQ